MKKPKLIRITTVPVSLKTLLRGQHRFMLEQGFEVTGVSSEGPELHDVAQQEGVRTIALEMSRKITPIQDIQSLWHFYRLCRREKPDLVHSHTPKAGLIGMLGAKLAGVPVRLHTVAGLPLMEASGIKRKVLDMVETLTYACATKVYPNSKGLYDFILQNGYAPASKLKVIGNGSSNGIDTAFFSPVQITDGQKAALLNDLGISDQDFVFIFVGRLVGDKGINELVKAFRDLKFKIQNSKFKNQNSGVKVQDSKFEIRNSKSEAQGLKLLLVGPPETELDPLLPETLQAIESDPDIISVGFQPDVRPYLAASDALVFPSYREGFPNVVMQAGAMGLPAIVTDINGCNEIIEEGRNGTIIPPKDSHALQAAMETFISDPERLAQLKAEARPMIASRYEQSVVWQALLAEYWRVISEK